MSARFRRATCVLAIGLAQALVLVPAARAQPESSPRAELRRGAFAALDRRLSGFQASYEAGQLTDAQLRDGYRPLYDLDGPLLEQLKSWVRSRPNSYAAHLLLGVHYKHLGDDARGGDFIPDTPAAAITEMKRQHQLAMGELERSTHLTAKPYLSWFLMLGIAQDEGSAAERLRILDQALRLDAVAELVRVRYMTTLARRWGGSRPRMEAFIARSQREGVPDRVVHELQAIEEDDKGKDSEDAGDDGAARQHFGKALALAADSAPFFLEDALQSSQRVLCLNTSSPAHGCPR